MLAAMSSMRRSRGSRCEDELCFAARSRNNATEQPPGRKNYFKLIVQRGRTEGFLVLDYISRATVNGLLRGRRLGQTPGDWNSRSVSGPVAPGPKPGGVAPSPARPPHSTVAIGGELPQGVTHWPITSGIAEATATIGRTRQACRRRWRRVWMNRTGASPPLRPPPAGNDAPLAPGLRSGEAAAAADWREGMLALAGLISASRWR